MSPRVNYCPVKNSIPFGQVGAEIPVDSEDADSENKHIVGTALLCVFERGCTIRPLEIIPFILTLNDFIGLNDCGVLQGLHWRLFTCW